MGFSCKIKIDSARPRRDGYAAVFMQVLVDRKKARIPLGIFWVPKRFDERIGCKPRSKKDDDVDAYNVIIGNARTKANNIHKEYLMRGLTLTLDLFMREYNSNLNKHDFLEYFKQKSFERWSKEIISDLTYKKEMSTLNRLTEFVRKQKGVKNQVLTFNEFTPDWAHDYDRFLKKNNLNTNSRWGQHKHLITYLNMASKIDNITFTHPYKRFKNQQAESSWGPLTLEQFKKLLQFYLDELPDKPTPNQRIVLRRFLFSCNCALRISDLQKLNRSMFSNGEMSITPHKTERYGTQIKAVPLNDVARIMLDDELNENPNGLFNRFTDQYSNRTLKECARLAGVEVKLHNHIARYTFASLYDQAGGNHTSLMRYMGLRKRDTLEKYVKTNKGVMQKDIARMNEFLK